MQQEYFASIGKEHQDINDDEVYYTAFCFSSEPMTFSDAETGPYLDVNKAFLDLFGYTRDEIIGRSLVDLHLCINSEDINKAQKTLREKGYLHNHPALMRAKDGKIIHGSLTINFIHVKSKKIKFTVIKDVTIYEKKLEQEKLYFQLLDNIPDVICIIDQEGNIKHRSSNNESIFGYRAGGMIGKKEIEYYHPDDRKSMLQELEIAESNENICFTKEVRYRCSDGSYKMVEVYCKNLKDNEFINGILLTYRDITERKTAERMIIEESNRYYTLINSVHDMIWIVDPVHFGLLVFNRSLYDYFREKGLTIEQGMTPAEILGNEYAPKWDNIYNMALREGPYSIEYQTVAKDKSLFLFIHPLTVEGELIGISVFGEDITERKKVIQQLNETIAHLEAIIENTEDFIYLLDKDFNLLIFNKAFKKYIYRCYKIELKPGMNIRSIFPAEYIDEWKALVRVIKESGQKRIEMESRVIPGTYFEFTFNPVSFQSKVESIAVYVKDITEQKATQKRIIRHNLTLEKIVEERTGALISALNELESFTYTISHDLKSPLRSIEAYSRIVLEDYGKEMNSDAVSMIRNIQTISLNRIALIDKLLTYSVAAKTDLNKEYVDLEEMIVFVFNQLKIQSRSEIFLIKETDLPNAFADKILIKQVICNILENSIKFSDPMKKAVISFGCLFENDELVYYIKDNGIGFETDSADKLFNIFYQAKQDAAQEGHGIGLAVAKKLVAAHGGRIWMEGVPHLGAIVYFVLPDAVLK